MEKSCLPVCVSQVIVLAKEAAARRLPSGLKATLQTCWVGPFRASSSLPVFPSHPFTALSSEAAARLLPLGLKATQPKALSMVRISSPVCASHTFTALTPPSLPGALLAQARRLPSGL